MPATSHDQARPEPVTDARPEFVVFYRQAYPGVARALAATLRDRELGIEAADEAMARCYARWSTVRNYANPEGWVYRVGLNWGRSWLRRVRRRRGDPMPVACDIGPVADPALHRAVAELDISLRSVVVCRYLLDWSVAQTAAALNLRPGTVKSRTHRALGQLQANLGHVKEDLR